ncbi:hypothetical protein K439DRAFT_855168 [Ramaria rubella]|nr:hypothetical protein K439DRAFT_855168 [Ramaria rubella]
MLSLAMLTAFPTAVMVLTFYRVLVIMRKNSNFRQCMAKKTSLTGLIMFETLCMCGVCFVRLINALWFLLAPITFNLGVNPFALPIAAIVISHFLLSLRDVNGRPGVDPTTSNHLAFTSCPFDSPANFCVDHDGDSNTCAERDREIEEEKSDGDETDEEDETLEREFPEQTIDWVGDPGRSVV